MEHYLNYLQDSIRRNWNSPALSDYQGNTFSYRDVAVEIEKYHLLFKTCGFKSGDKMVLCAKNSARWASTFLSVTTYNAVVVPLLNDFLPENVVELASHSDSVIMFTDRTIWAGIVEKGLKKSIEKNERLKFVVDVNSGLLLYSQGKSYENLMEDMDNTFVEKYPNGLRPEDVRYEVNDIDNLAIISYTSGTTSSPKGVMISARSISSNVTYSIARMPNKPGWTILSMLPMAHLYGLVCDFLYPFSTGCHIYFLGKTPTPSVLLRALADVKPYMVLMVPLVIEKIFKSKIIPTLEKPAMRFMMSVPGLRRLLLHSIKGKLLKLFGGQLYDGLVLGGAAINEKVEKLLKEIGVPYTVGYGMTECGPLICYEHFDKYKARSCGKPVWSLKMKINSTDPQNVPGEILVKGANVMEGYYKNEEATREVFDKDGWMRTGDMGVMDAEGNLFIKGRCKNMLLSPNGQNIYPEEIEDKLNTSPYVMESLVVSRSNVPVALVYPDEEAVKGITPEQKQILFDEFLKSVNMQLPAYSKLGRIELMEEPFEKTPKKSIKRFLYNEE